MLVVAYSMVFGLADCLTVAVLVVVTSAIVGLVAAAYSITAHRLKLFVFLVHASWNFVPPRFADLVEIAAFEDVVDATTVVACTYAVVAFGAVTTTVLVVSCLLVA